MTILLFQYYFSSIQTSLIMLMLKLARLFQYYFSSIQTIANKNKQTAARKVSILL